MTTNESTACPKCYGTGQLPIAQHVDPTHTRKLAPILCPRCGGTGRKESERP
jgi:DnaJ-class molecular chaperone